MGGPLLGTGYCWTLYTQYTHCVAKLRYSVPLPDVGRTRCVDTLLHPTTRNIVPNRTGESYRNARSYIKASSYPTPCRILISAHSKLCLLRIRCSVVAPTFLAPSHPASLKNFTWTSHWHHLHHHRQKHNHHPHHHPLVP